jgi:hypothetical protein
MFSKTIINATESIIDNEKCKVCSKYILKKKVQNLNQIYLIVQ